MFIIPEHKQILIVVPSTGSNSFRNSIKNIHQVFPKPKNHPVFEMNDIKTHEHLTAGQARIVIEEQYPGLWDKYEKIGFVRHPYNWLRSVYSRKGFKRVFGIDNECSVSKFIKNIDKTPYFWFEDEYNKLLIDKIYRTEDLVAILGKDYYSPYLHVNQTQNLKDFKLTKKDKEIIKDKFWREFTHYEEEI